MRDVISRLMTVTSRRFRYNFVAFIAFNCLLYGWILAAHQLVPFQNYNYHFNADHYIADSRIAQPTGFHLTRDIAEYDAQWYLRLADHGYGRPSAPGKYSVYAFSPAYPLLLAGVRVVFRNELLSAFILTQLIVVASFIAAYRLVTRWHSEKLASKTVWLLFAYPFSIFYHSYYSEGLFLLLLALLLEQLQTRHWFRAALAAGLLAATRFVGVAGILVLGVRLLHSKYRPISWRAASGYIAVACIPLLILCLVDYHQTGQALYFLKAEHAWFREHNLFPGYPALWSITHFFNLPWHRFHESRLDTLSIVVFGGLLWFSRRWLPRSWWAIALLLWLIPVLTSDTMSASRYQIINLPLFIYAAHKLQGRYYAAALVVSFIGLAVVALLFSNWVWIG